MKNTKSPQLSIFLILFIAANTAMACKCKNITHEEAFNNADTTITGRIDKIDTLDQNLQIQISGNSSFSFLSPRSSAACGMKWNLGKVYVVHLRKNKESYSTNSCSKNFVLKGNENILKQYKK